MLDAVADTLNDAAREALGHEPVGEVPRVLRGRSQRRWPGLYRRQGHPGIGPGECESAAPDCLAGSPVGGNLMKLSHVDEAGRARMVDVSEKPVTTRTARAEGRVWMSREAFELVEAQADRKSVV